MPDATEQEKVDAANKIKEKYQKTRKLRIALKAAVDVIELVNRNKRKFPDGSVRKDVKTGIKDQHEHEKKQGGGCDSYISAKSAEFFEWMYGSLGYWIGSKPNVAFAIGMIICISGIPGTFFLQGTGSVLYLKMDTSTYSNFALTDHPNTLNYEYTRTSYNGWFHNNRAGLLWFEAKKSSHEVTDKAVAAPAIETSLWIQNTILSQNKSFQEYCLRNGAGLCTWSDPWGLPPISSNVTALDDLPGKELYGTFPPTSMYYVPPYTGEPLEAPNDQPNELWGQYAFARNLLRSQDVMGPAFNFNGMTYSTAASPGSNKKLDWRSVPVEQWHPKLVMAGFMLEWHLQDTDETEDQVEWETETSNYLYDERYYDTDILNIYFLLESNVELELARMAGASIPLMFATVFVMVLYAETFLCTQVRIDAGTQTQANFVSFGSNISSAAGLGSLGWMAYLGFKINVLCTFVMFLILCVGVDCIFIYVSAMKAVGPQVKELPVAMSMCLAEAATACTLTGLTSICAFFLSAAFSTNLPGMFVFSLAMGFAMILNFLGFLFGFTGYQIQNEKRIMAGMSDALPCKKASGKPIPAFLTVGDKLRAWINTKYAPLFRTSFCFKAWGAGIMFGSFVISIAFVPSLEVGMTDKYLMLDTSFIYDIYDTVFDEIYDNKVPFSFNMLVEHLDVNDMTQLRQFHDFVVQPLYDNELTTFVDCGPDAFYEWKVAYPELAGTPEYEDWHTWLAGGDRDPSIAFLRSVFFGGKRVYYYNEVGYWSQTEVPQAHMCIVYYEQTFDDFFERVKDVNEYNDLVEDIMEDYAADCYPCNPIKITFGSLQWSQTIAMDEMIIIQVWTTIIVAVAAVALVLFLALPISRAVISAINILLIVINILGFMAMIECGYNSISYATLSMAIGFCVDYTVETMHFSVVGDPTDPAPVKFESAIKACGYDVFHGCMTAFIGVMMISFVPSQAMRWFGWLSMIMCLFGGTYALWCLPAVIVLLSQAFSGAGKKKAEPNGTGTKV